MANTIGTGDKTDFDETRRLLYMALAARLGTKKYNLVGTTTNALVHHHGLTGDDDPGVIQIMRKLIAVVDGQDGAEDAAKWVEEQIRRITYELDD